MSAVATALGWTSKEAEKAVQVAKTAMTQTVAALKGRKLEASKPKQSRTLLPVTTKETSNGRLASGDTISETPASLSDQTNCAADALTTGQACTAKVWSLDSRCYL